MVAHMVWLATLCNHCLAKASFLKGTRTTIAHAVCRLHRCRVLSWAVVELPLVEIPAATVQNRLTFHACLINLDVGGLPPGSRKQASRSWPAALTHIV